MDENKNPSKFGNLRNSHAGRLLLLGVLMLLLHIPLSLIKGLMHERQATQMQAVTEVSSKWGLSQTFIGPRIVVPYVERWRESKANDSFVERHQVKYAHFLPETLNVKAAVSHEIRRRGIFEVPVYQTRVRVSGGFSPPDFSQWPIKAKDISWAEARLVFDVSDARAIQEQANVEWNGVSLPLEPGGAQAGASAPGFHAVIGKAASGAPLSFSVEFHFNGSEGLFFAPVGKYSQIEINSDWPDPSFQGKWLPTQRDINEDGFKAAWKIPYLGRGFSQQSTESAFLSALPDYAVGVNFVRPIDHYRMAHRGSKYALLFMTLTFLSLWLFEILCGLRVHAVQYLLTGSALCMFYLLQLALSEHLGFTIAYVLAASAVAIMVSAYSLVMLATRKRSAILAAGLAMLYAYLYSLLLEQNYALLLGSVGLFVILGAVMYLTRKVDWLALKTP